MVSRQYALLSRCPPTLVGSFNVMMPAKGLPSAMIFSLLLQEALALVAELKLILKQDLDLDLDVPRFNCYVSDNRLNDDQARALLQSTLVLFGSRYNGCGCVYKGTTCCRCAYRR